MDQYTAMPSLKSVKDLLTGLVGRDVDVATGAEPVAVGGSPGSVIGLYVDDGLDARAAVVADFALAAYLGAVLGLVPAGGAEAAIEDGELPTSLFENVHEALNIMASLFNVEDAPHLRLYSASKPDEVLRPDVRELALRPAPREDITVHVSRYGQGAMSIVVA